MTKTKYSTKTNFSPFRILTIPLIKGSMARKITINTILTKNQFIFHLKFLKIFEAGVNAWSKIRNQIRVLYISDKVII